MQINKLINKVNRLKSKQEQLYYISAVMRQGEVIQLTVRESKLSSLKVLEQEQEGFKEYLNYFNENILPSINKERTSLVMVLENDITVFEEELNI